jgi:Predicted integral membrane protein (DUF2269)
MDQFLLLRFARLIGLMRMSAGLIGVFIADMRSRQVRDMKLFAQAVTFIAVFYDGLVVPGALLLLASGSWLIVSYHGGWDFLRETWLVGMVILFALGWTQFVLGVVIAVAASSLLNYAVPCLYPWGGEDAQSLPAGE